MPKLSLKKLLSRIKDRKIGKGKTVLVAFSGGVDSSVATYILKLQGYKVIAGFMKNWSDTKNELTGECSWREERRMALRVAAKLNIPLKTFDFEKSYRKDVIDEMFLYYKNGLTPNPDVVCNQKIKFPLFWKEAKKLKADLMATGHYVRRLPEQGKSKEYKLLRAICEKKDQSYFLYRTTQSELSHTLFPIGYYTKEEVRFMAKELEFHNYDKKGTKGICFIGKINLKDFLQQKIPPKKGRFVTPEGKIVGEHDGIMYYTIGQRIGPRFGMNIKKQPGKESGQRWYVAIKNVKKNEIIVAPEGHNVLLRKEIAVLKKNFHFINKKTHPKKVLARIRHVGELLPSQIKYDKEKKIYLITLKQAITGVAQGQSVVLYNKDEVIGGGEIVFPEMIK